MSEFALPQLVDYSATFIWALSGGLIAARRGYDVVGIAGVALVSATGGGLLRDGLFLQDGPPRLVRTANYMGLVLTAVAVVLLVGRRVARVRAIDEALALVDAVGLGAYAVVGVQLALLRQLHPLGVVLVGVVTAVGGSVLRDMVMRRDPDIFKPGTLLALASMVGCLVFLGCTRWLALDEVLSTWVTIGVVVGLRSASVYYGWRTRAIVELEAEAYPPRDT